MVKIDWRLKPHVLIFPKKYDSNSSNMKNGNKLGWNENTTQPTITRSKLTIERLEQGMKYV